MTTHTRRALVPGLLLLLAAACADDEPAPTTATSQVGPGGGTLGLPGGGSIKVPAGALAAEVKITVTLADAPLVGLRALGQFHRFEPAGLTFKAPIQISLPVDTAQVPASADKNVAVYWTLAGSRTYAALSSTFDRAAGTVSAQVTHFSAGGPGMTAMVCCDFLGARVWNTSGTCKKAAPMSDCSLSVCCGTSMQGVTLAPIFVENKAACDKLLWETKVPEACGWPGSGLEYRCCGRHDGTKPVWSRGPSPPRAPSTPSWPCCPSSRGRSARVIGLHKYL